MSKKYDAIIVGAGIGGLVCGCYLAKSGMKVLILEKHDRPGGYCTSFRRKNFNFDVAIHYFGGIHNGGQISNILEELKLKERFEIVKFNPSDKIITPEYETFIYEDYRETLSGLIKAFPTEKKQLEMFFEFLLQKNFYKIYTKASSISFQDLLDMFFADSKLKAIFSILLGNIGVPPKKASALTAIVLYRDFILFPGNYPKGGIQKFPDLLKKRFIEYGGEIILKKKVNKIILGENNKVHGVEVEGEKVFSSIVVSNADANHTFNHLLGGEEMIESKKISKLKTSIAPFAVYLGLNTNIEKVLRKPCSTWFFDTYDIDMCYGDTKKCVQSEELPYIVLTFPSFHENYNVHHKTNESTVEIFMGAPYETKEFWDGYSEILYEKCIKKAEKVIPGLSSLIDVKVIGTPHTFYRYTNNMNGAMYGWASTVDQISRDLFPQRSSVDGLYLAGHWCTNGLGQGGISGVSYSGRHIAKLIVNKFKRGRL